MVKFKNCRCILDEASDRWSYEEYKKMEWTYYAELDEDEVVDDCLDEHGRRW
jgi:hypothetical protein